MSLQKDLAALRAEPGVHLATLAKVDSVMSRYAGARLTVQAGSARQKRLQQAYALVTPNATRPRAILTIAGALGVSPSTARRYFDEISKSNR